MYWHIELDGKILPTQYGLYDTCMKEIRRMRETLVAPCLNAVLI